MKKQLLIFFISTLTLLTSSAAQTDSFDVFTYQPPEFFIKNELQSDVQFNLTNNDSTFCIISLFKRGSANADVIKDIISQWNTVVLKQLAKSNKPHFIN